MVEYCWFATAHMKLTHLVLMPKGQHYCTTSECMTRVNLITVWARYCFDFYFWQFGRNQLLICFCKTQGFWTRPWFCSTGYSNSFFKCPTEPVSNGITAMQSRRFDRSPFRYSIWNHNLTGSLQYKVIHDVHIYSLLHKGRKGHWSEGSEGREEVGSGLSTLLWTSATVTVLSRKITIVEHSPHILSTGSDPASDTLSATYISWIGSNKVDMWQPLHKTDTKQQTEWTRWGSWLFNVSKTGTM